MSYKTSDNEISDQDPGQKKKVVMKTIRSIIQDINDAISELFKNFVPTNGSFQLVKLNLSTVYHKSFH